MTAPPRFEVPFQQRVLDATVKIRRCDGTWGSGVFTGTNAVLTCAHVIGNEGERVTLSYRGNNLPGIVEVAIRSSRGTLQLPDLAKDSH